MYLIVVPESSSLSIGEACNFQLGGDYPLLDTLCDLLRKDSERLEVTEEQQVIITSEDRDLYFIYSNRGASHYDRYKAVKVEEGSIVIDLEEDIVTINITETRMLNPSDEAVIYFPQQAITLH